VIQTDKQATSQSVSQ